MILINKKALVGSGLVSGAGYVVKERHDYVNRKSIALEFLEERPKLEMVDDDMDDDNDDNNMTAVGVGENHIDNLLRNYQEQKKRSGNDVVITTVHKNLADFHLDIEKLQQQQQQQQGSTTNNNNSTSGNHNTK